MFIDARHAQVVKPTGIRGYGSPPARGRQWWLSLRLPDAPCADVDDVAPSM